MASRIPCATGEVARPIGAPDTREDHLFLQSQPDVQGRTTLSQTRKGARMRPAATEGVEQRRPRAHSADALDAPAVTAQPSWLGQVAPSSGHGALYQYATLHFDRHRRQLTLGD